MTNHATNDNTRVFVEEDIRGETIKTAPTRHNKKKSAWKGPWKDRSPVFKLG